MPDEGRYAGNDGVPCQQPAMNKAILRRKFPGQFLSSKCHSTKMPSKNNDFLHRGPAAGAPSLQFRNPITIFGLMMTTAKVRQARGRKRD
jgi:hypothetical protein